MWKCILQYFSPIISNNLISLCVHTWWILLNIEEVACSKLPWVGTLSHLPTFLQFPYTLFLLTFTGPCWTFMRSLSTSLIALISICRNPGRWYCWILSHSILIGIKLGYSQRKAIPLNDMPKFLHCKWFLYFTRSLKQHGVAPTHPNTVEYSATPISSQSTSNGHVTGPSNEVGDPQEGVFSLSCFQLG